MENDLDLKQSAGRSEKLIILWSLTALVIFQVVFTYFCLFEGMAGLYKENNVHENTQALVLLVALVFYLVHARHLGRYNLPGNIFMALLCFTFFLREVEIQDLNIHNVFIVLLSGTGKRVLLGTLWAGMVLWLLMYLKVYLRNAVALAKTRYFHLIFAGGVSLVVGDIFEKDFFNIESHVFYEESFELIGFYLIFAAAVISGRQMTVTDRNNL